jgi:hypothetical protein
MQLPEAETTDTLFGQFKLRDLSRDSYRGKPEMNKRQEAVSAEQPPQTKGNFKLTPIAKASPIMIGLIIGVGFGPSVYNAIGETTGWGSHSIATFCIGTLLVGIVGGVIAGISMMVVNFLGIKVKA